MGTASFSACFVLSHLLLLHIHIAEATSKFHPLCPQSFNCRNFGSFGFPFTNNTYPGCGVVILYCDVEIPKVQLATGQLYNFTGITHEDTLQIQDHALQNLLSLRSCDDTFKNLSLPNLPFINFTILHNLAFFKCSSGTNPGLTAQADNYFSGNYKNYKGCPGYSVYYKYPDDGESSSTPAGFPHHCSAIQLPVLPPQMHPNASDPFGLVAANFSLKLFVSPDCYECRDKGGQCVDVEQEFRCMNGREGNKWKFLMRVAIGISAAGVVTAIILIFCFKRKCLSVKSLLFWKKETENNKKIEAMLKNYGSLAPKRYNYSEVKKMTNSFKYKLGRGGYGGVYKGKLQNGHLVAVKILNDSTGNGEEFTNEVASISRTSHINIVTLLGFCFEGKRRALIYEFMPNGSLEKFIYNGSSSKQQRQLGWETLYQIAVGIAQGLEYLHRGCNTRILHFDIKPHNILLDEDLCPKISDFGLSKLYPKKDGMIISMLGTRGTAGYIAPEVFSRNFGEVSHKSDVYSYGMMVLEMVGGRKNVDVRVDHTSEIYFPHWIHKRLQVNEDDLGLYGIMNEEENERARKMIIVGLWCIQTDPSRRPPMSRVVDMLEGNPESLQIPPLPILSSPPRLPADCPTSETL